MEDDSLNIAMLAKRIEKQEQFTRMVSLICCISILSVMFYTVTEVFSDLPQLIVVHAMSHMSTMVSERHLVDSSINGQAAAQRSSEQKSIQEKRIQDMSKAGKGNK